MSLAELQFWLYPALVALAGYLVLGLTGFGSALVIVPLLAWRWPLAEVVALIILMDVPMSMLHGGLNLRQVRWAELWRLLPGLALGTVAGFAVAPWLSAKWSLLALGLYVAWVGLSALRGPQAMAQRRPTDARWAHVYGFVIGVIESSFGTAGPPLVAWLQRRLDDVHELRATIPVVMMVAASGVLLGMALAGRLSGPQIWQRWAVLVGVAALGVWAGNRLARHLSVALVRRLICALLVLSGLVLAGKALA